MDLPLRMGRDRVWFEFEKAGFTKEDLLLVIRWIRVQIPKRTGYSENSLRFSTLLQLDYFEEKLLLARAQLRTRPPRTRDEETRSVDLGNGESITVQDPEKPRFDEPATPREATSEFLANLKRQLKGGVAAQ